MPVGLEMRTTSMAATSKRSSRGGQSCSGPRIRWRPLSTTSTSPLAAAAAVAGRSASSGVWMGNVTVRYCGTKTARPRRSSGQSSRIVTSPSRSKKQPSATGVWRVSQPSRRAARLGKRQRPLRPPLRSPSATLRTTAAAAAAAAAAVAGAAIAAGSALEAPPSPADDVIGQRGAQRATAGRRRSPVKPAARQAERQADG